MIHRCSFLSATMRGCLAGTGLLLLATTLAAAGLERARQYIAAGDDRAAVIELRDSLERDPGDQEARRLLAGIYLRAGYAVAAEGELKRVADLGADPSLWLLDLAETKILLGKAEEAIALLARAGALAPTVVQRALSLKALAQMGMNRLPEAKATLKRAMDTAPDDPMPALAQIQLQIVEGDLTAASTAAETLVARFPDDPEVLMARAGLHLKQGEGDAAARLYDAAQKRSPGSMRVLLGHAAAMIQLGDTQRATADLARVDAVHPNMPHTLMLRAVIAYRADQLDAAESYLKQVHRVLPDEPQPQLLLGAIALRKGELASAEDYLGRVLGEDPDNRDALRMMVSAQLRMGNPRSAIDTLEPAVARNPSAELMTLLASTYLKAGDPQGAQRWLGQALALTREQPRLQAQLKAQLGVSRLAAGEAQRAIAELRDAAEQSVGLPTDTLLIMAHLQAREPDQALALANALAEREPVNAHARNLAGIAHLLRGDQAKAAELFHQALAVDPGLVDAAVNLGQLELAGKDPTAAQAHFSRALEHQPDQVDALLGMARVCEQRADATGQREWLQRAVRAAPQAREPALRLARLQLVQGDYAPGLETALRLATRFPDDPGVTELLGRAQALGGDTASAMATFDRLLGERPNDAVLHRLIGVAKWRAKDLSGARASLARATELDPEMLPAWVALGQVELDSGNIFKALDVTQRLKRDHPESPEGYLLEGRAYLAFKRPDQAVRTLDAGWRKLGTGALARQLAQAHAAGGQRREALAVLSTQLAREPKDREARRLFAWYAVEEGRRDEAITAYQALVAETEEIQLLNDLAWLYQEAGDPRAKETARRAYVLAPNMPDVADTYGWILIQGGEAKAGVDILERTFDAFPTRGDIGYRLAVGLSRTGRERDAVRLLRQLLWQHPKLEQAKEAQALLQRLER